MLLAGHIFVLLAGIYLLVGQVSAPPLLPPRSKPRILLQEA